jgi:organic radical activating enzyme
MFGQNQIMKREFDRNGVTQPFLVQEVFHTLQGEGPFSGQPAVFVRFAGCHLACTFCDTDFESAAHNQSLDELVRTIEDCRGQARLVVLTGGEPMRQTLHKLVGRLVDGFEGVAPLFGVVQIETAGTFWEPELLPFIQREKLVVVCSPKTRYVHPLLRSNCDDWKYVVRAGSFGAPARLTPFGIPYEATQTHAPDGLAEPSHKPVYVDLGHGRIREVPKKAVVWLSPCDEYDDVKNAANRQLAVELCLDHGHKLSLQVHKIVKLP